MSGRGGHWQRCLLLVGLVALVGSEATAADPPPSRAELEAKVARDPIRLANWKAWRERLQDWLGEPADRTGPVYDSARKFLKDAAGDKVRMPRPLEKDALAWYLLGNAYWRDAEVEADPGESLKRADKALTRSVQLDGNNPHAHFNRAQVLLRMEDVRKPGRHNGGRLDKIRKDLAAARKLNPALTLPAWDEGMLLYRLKDYPSAEKLLRKAMTDNPGKVEIPQYVARCIVMPKMRPGKRAEAMRELVALFPSDGMLAAIQAMALSMDGDKKSALEELKRARSAGFDPKKVLSKQTVERIEREGGTPVAVKPPDSPSKPPVKPVDPPAKLPDTSFQLLSGKAPTGSPADVAALLARQPITDKNWKTWSTQLRQWVSKQDDPVYRPAFDVARKFARSQLDAGLHLPRPLNDDAIAWLLVGQALFHESNQGGGMRGKAIEAEKALRHSVGRDKKLARAHHDLALVILRLEMPHSRFGEHVKTDSGRLKEARKQLAEARTWDPTSPGLPAHDEGNIAFRTEDWEDAERLYNQALTDNPEDAEAARSLARCLFRNPKKKGQRAAAIGSFAARFPTDGGLACLHGLALGEEGQVEAGADEFKRARSLGTDPAKYVDARTVRKIEEAAKPSFFTSWVVRPMIFFTIFYASVMALMFLAGLVLAKYTRGVKAVELLDAPANSLVGAQGQVARSIHETRLTKFYVAILTLALVLFYFAIPFVLWGLLILLLVVLLLGFFLRRDYGTAQMHGQMLRASGGGLFAVFRALFASFGKGSFGILKTEDDCPRLYQMLHEVAKRVDTDPVDEVYVAPGSEMCVHQEGRGPFGIFGTKRRVLTIGLSTLPFLTVTELKAILAHEYAHFSHKDTFYIRFIHQVTLSIRTAMQGMAKAGGWMTYVNPFYWFFYLYYKSYSLLSSGFSRSREFLADRMACTLYGSDSFINGLTKVAADGTLFEQTMYKEVAEMLRKKKAYVNMYLAFRKNRDNEKAAKDRDKLWKQILKQEASLFDSHPTIPERFEAARAFPKAKKTDPTPALQLFEDPAEIEKELTDFLTEAMDYIRRMNR